MKVIAKIAKIYHSMSYYLCERCKQVDRRISDFINTQPNEDSITDVLLWQLQELNPNLTIVRFNKYEESEETGADFAISNLGIFFVHKEKEQYIGLALQAKKILKEKVECKNTIAYKNGYQMDLLEEYSKKNKYLPMYIFYTYLSLNNCIGNLPLCEECIISLPYPYRLKRKWIRYLLQKYLEEDFLNKCFPPLNFIPKFTSLHLQNIFYLKKLRDENCKQNNKIEKEKLLENSIPFCCVFCSPLANRNNPSPIEHILEFLWFSFFKKEEYKDFKSFKKDYLRKELSQTLKLIKLGKEEKLTDEILFEDGILIAKRGKYNDKLFEALDLSKKINRIFLFEKLVIFNI